jgi:hypothetical protein
MKHLKKFNESDSHIERSVKARLVKHANEVKQPESQIKSVPAQKRYVPIKYGYKDNALFMSFDPSRKVISFETADNGVNISDISKIEDIINFLMDEKDKLM